MRQRARAWLALPVIAGLCVASEAGAVCVVGAPGSEPTLQQVFGSLLGSAAPDVEGSCLDDGSDAQWRTNGESTVTIVIELAGFSNTNRLGIYDVTDPSNQFQLFGGAAGVGARATITFAAADTGYSVTVAWPNNPAAPPQTRIFGSSVFGFYLSTEQDNPNTPTADRSVYFSQTSLNDDGTDHLFAYQGNGGTFVSGALGGETFAPDNVLLAWEDLRGGGDRDYQDVVVYARSLATVPLPPALAFLISGLVVVGALRRRPPSPPS